GDAEFVQFVRARQGTLLRAARLYCGDQHIAEGLLQEGLRQALTCIELNEQYLAAHRCTIVVTTSVREGRRGVEEKPNRAGGSTAVSVPRSAPSSRADTDVTARTSVAP